MHVYIDIFGVSIPEPHILGKKNFSQEGGLGQSAHYYSEEKFQILPSMTFTAKPGGKESYEFGIM